MLNRSDLRYRPVKKAIHITTYTPPPVEKRTKSELEESMIGKQVQHRSLSSRRGTRRVR